MKTTTKTTIHSVYRNVLILPGPILSGIFVYIILSHLLVPLRITAPVSIIMSVLVFGLSSYYGDTRRIDQQQQQSFNKDVKTELERDTDKENINNKSISKVLFSVGYIISLIIVGFISQSNTNLFVSWNHITAINIFQLISAIVLCFFLPGYALVDALDRKHELEPILRILLSYIFSILVTGLSTYILAASGFAISHANIPLVIVYSSMLILFVCMNVLHRGFKRSSIHFNFNRKIWITLKRNSSEFIIFGSLFALVVLFTYYLYGGVIIGDQWFNHGRSLMFISGAFKDLAASRVDILYPPFFSALLASFFTLSGIPSVNAYVSIAFLNIIPVFAFYYFFTKWFPTHKYNRSPAMIACVLFMLSAGLGWTHVINMAATGPITSQISVLNILQLAGIKTFDIRLPSTFIGVGHPDITTGLIIIALPAGFVLLGMIKQNVNNKFKYVIILSAISCLGVLFHDEYNIFIIFASIIPLVFKIPKRNSIFASSLFALILAILFDLIFPGRYYTVREILKIPLIALLISFVILMWILYAMRISNKLHLPKVLTRAWTRISYILTSIPFKLIVVSAVSYLYIFSFMVWNDLSTQEVHAQTLNNGQRDIPWYLYPMKLGVTGILGMAFILSYLFKRFEKEIFVFGIIAMICFVAGPYYDEHRMSKYIMVGMVGFASFLFYRIVTHITKNTNNTLNTRSFLISGVLAGLIITCSSLSVLMYTSYSALGLENPRFKPFNTTLTARFFPSPSEIHMLRYMDNFLINPKIDNIAEPTDESVINQGLITKLQGFSAMPLPKLAQSPLTLNSSTLEAFYTLLSYSDSHYILLPKKDIHAGLPEITSFALQNFQRSYENDNYVILKVPPISPPSNNGNTGLIYQRNELPSSLYNNSGLSYSDRSFSNTPIPKFIKIENKNAILNSTNGRQLAFWSSNFNVPKVNYIEGRFRIIDENKDNQQNIGLVWNDENNRLYYALVNNNGVVVRNPVDNTVLHNPSTFLQKGVWYNLKIAFMKNSTNVYLNDFLQTKLPRIASEGSGIYKVGISSLNNVAEFEPIRIGQVSDLGEQLYQNYHHYALSALALSGLQYDTFTYGDLSALSKRNLVLTFDPLWKDNVVGRYLEFARKGGNLVVFNENGNARGYFSELFSIQLGKASQFDSIGDSNMSQYITASGITNSIISRSTDITPRSFYFDNNHQMVAPFVIEKNYGNGKIIFINAYGYFNAISKSPSQFFTSLKNIVNMVDLTQDKYVKTNSLNATLPTRFIGKAVGDGLTEIKTSSMVENRNYNFHVGNIIYNPDQNNSKSGINYQQQQYQQNPNTGSLKNVTIKDFELSGPVEVSIISNGFLYSPSLSFVRPLYDYIPLFIPTGFDMKFKLHNGSSAKFMIGNNSYPITASNGEIQLHDIKADYPNIRYISILVKNPEVNVRGNTNFDQFYSNDPNDPTRAWAYGDQLNIQGNLVAKFDHIDNYKNASGTQYVTYLKQLHIDGYTNIGHQDLRIPGDISKYAKEHGIEIPWKSILFSSNNPKVLATIAITTVAGTFILWPRIRKVT